MNDAIDRLQEDLNHADGIIKDLAAERDELLARVAVLREYVRDYAPNGVLAAEEAAVMDMRARLVMGDSARAAYPKLEVQFRSALAALRCCKKIHGSAGGWRADAILAELDVTP